jgi:hypothetical protein
MKQRDVTNLNNRSAIFQQSFLLNHFLMPVRRALVVDRFTGSMLG